MNTIVIGTVSKNYPDAVRNAVNLAMEVIVDAEMVGPETDTDADIMESLLCESALTKFLGDGEIFFNEEEFVSMCHLAAAQTAIRDLKDAGFVDSIEDENGREIMWLTQQGIDHANKLKETYAL